MIERDRGNLTAKLDKIYFFVEQLYSGNWNLRFARCPYMKNFSQPDQIKDFVDTFGKFESVPGHTWVMGIMNYLILDACPNLGSTLDPEKVTRLILFHDVREIDIGDTPAHEILAGLDNQKEERENLLRLLSSLPPNLAKDILEECEAYEVSSPQNPTLEILYVRFLDTLQSGNCVLTHGNDFVENSPLIEKTMKARTVRRARMLIDRLRAICTFDSQIQNRAVGEVDALVRFHISKFRTKGANLDFSELGF